jgi:mRNA degradation ribonuclease J1/J2
LEEERLLDRAVIAREDNDLRIGPGVTVRAFPVPHCPGATGFVLRDRSAALFYTGDVCLATARHDFLPELVARVHADPAGRKTVLLDATMAGRKEGASSAVAAAQVRALLGAVPDVILCSQDASQLLYAAVSEGLVVGEACSRCGGPHRARTCPT